MGFKLDKQVSALLFVPVTVVKIVLRFRSLLRIQGNFSLWTLTYFCHPHSWIKSSGLKSWPLNGIPLLLIDAFGGACMFWNSCEAAASRYYTSSWSPICRRFAEPELCFLVLLNLLSKRLSWCLVLFPALVGRAETRSRLSQPRLPVGSDQTHHHPDS